MNQLMKCGLVFIILITCVSCLYSEEQNHSKNHPSDPVTSTVVFNPITITKREVITNNLNVPWTINKLGDTFYISERPGIIVVINNEEAKREYLDLDKKVLHLGEGGLLGFVLSPNFKMDQSAYLYHTYEENEEIYNRVIKVKRVEGNWKETDVLLDKIEGGPIHNGGRIKIGPDQKLYVTTGDASHEEWAQDRSTYAGSILRMNLDGTTPVDNPFEESYIYSYGHRNPQGLTWTKDGQLYSTEHGAIAHDEINIIYPGRNYGWPVIIEDETRQGMVTPWVHSGDRTWAPSGAEIYNGYLYVACLRGSQIRAFDLKTGDSKVIWENEGRIRDILFDQKERALYLITNNTDGRGNPAEEDDQLIKLYFE